MVQLFTAVESAALRTILSPGDTVSVLGSCFADSISSRLRNAGFDLCANPFGTLYNPASIASAMERLDSAEPFTEADCVEMGAGADLVCSFSHHTSFARADTQEFLANANNALTEASDKWRNCGKVIITLGTARVWRHVDRGIIVSNCLKRPAAEFTHDMLATEEISEILKRMVDTHPGKEFIFTLSPIRHLGLGAHDNAVSKARLLLGIDNLGSKADYFPAYEIMLDQLRDYRFYAEDLNHPSKLAVDIIWEKFLDAAVPDIYREAIRENERAARRSAHRPLR